MLRGMVVALMLVALSSSADARVALRDYIAAKNGDQKTLLKMYFGGVIDGLVMSDASLAIERRQRLFCMPENLVLTFEQAEDIMLREAQKDPDNAKDNSISALLVGGLEDTFPCQH